MKRAVFLDRDGVLNRSIVKQGKPFAPKRIKELEILPNVKEACDILHKEGYLLIVITNQPDVARGNLPIEIANQINSELITVLPLDDIKVCYHDDENQCTCRKPKPGLILEAAKEWNIDLSKSFVVGDRWKDIEAGRSSGCKTIFIDNRYNEVKPYNYDYYARSLFEALDIILNSTEKR